MTNKTSSGGGDNKIHQIIMAVITTIAAPVVVFLVTNNIKNSAAPTPTPIIQVVTATAPAKTAVDAAATAVPQKTNTATLPAVTDQKPTASPTQPGVSNPRGTILAGTPVSVDGLVLTVSAQDVKNDGKTISVSVHIKNPGKDRRTLSFTPGSITLKDDGGHTYAVLYGEKKSACSKNEISVKHSLDIAPQGEVMLTSVSADKASDWCAENPGGAIPLFNGPVGRNAKKLEVVINGVGPFGGFQMEVGL